MPFETLALPLLWWVNKLPWLDANGFSLGWLDTYQVQIVPFIANAFSIFLFYQFFDSIPKELDEAAVVDGAGWFHIYRKIVMPLSGPAIATVAILTFLPAWNSYLWPLMVVQSENLRPAMVGIDYFKQLNVSWGQLMAYATMITVPVLGSVRRLPTLLHQLHRLLRRERLTKHVPTPRSLGVGLLARRRRRALPPFLPLRLRALGDPDARHHRASIGHAISTDLTHWERVRDALVRSDPPAFDDLATWTGSVIQHPDGTWFLFYTGATLDPDGVNIQQHRLRHLHRPDALDQEPRKPGPDGGSALVRDDRRRAMARRGLPRPVGLRRPRRRRLAHADHRTRQPRAGRRPRRHRPRPLTGPAPLGASATAVRTGPGIRPTRSHPGRDHRRTTGSDLLLPGHRDVPNASGHRHHRRCVVRSPPNHCSAPTRLATRFS